MKKLMSIIAIGATSVSLLGCGGGPDSDLSEADAGVMLGIVMSAAFSGIAAGILIPEVQAFGNVPVNVDFDFNQSVPCPNGGTQNIVGNIFGQYDTSAGGTLNMDFTQTPMSCGINTGENTITITGNPNLQVTSSMSWSGSGPSGTSTFSINGGFSWDTGGASGNCNVNLTMSWSATSASFSGSSCGYNFNQNIG